MLWSTSTNGMEIQKKVAYPKAQNALIPLYRKELRKVLLEYLQRMRAMKKDYTFQKVMETQKDLKVKIQMDLIGYNRQNWPLISGNSCLIDCL